MFAITTCDAASKRVRSLELPSHRAHEGDALAFPTPMWGRGTDRRAHPHRPTRQLHANPQQDRSSRPSSAARHALFRQLQEARHGPPPP
jgi:hypothetical protein